VSVYVIQLIFFFINIGNIGSIGSSNIGFFNEFTLGIITLVLSSDPPYSDVH